MVSHGDHRPFVTAARSDAPIPGLERGALRPGRRRSGLDEGGPRVGIPVARAGHSARLPALSCWPGQRAAQLHRWAAEGKRRISAPVSAISTSAVRRFTPGMVISCVSAV